MATKVGEAYLELTARNAKLKTKMQESEKAGRSFTQRMQASLVKFGKVAFVGAIAGFTALTAVMIKAGKAAAAEELQTIRLTHQMGRLGVATQKNVDRVETLATELQNFTRFGDTETRKVLSILMTLSNDFEASLQNVGLAFDIAESGMFDVRTAARYIGLALTGNVEILGRYVSELKGSTNAQLKFMSSSEKAAFAITLLNQKFGGLAKQIGDTTAGAWAKLANTVSDAWEALGAGMLDELTVGFDDTTSAVKRMIPTLEKVGVVLGKLVKGALRVAEAVSDIAFEAQYILAPETTIAAAKEKQQIELMKIDVKRRKAEKEAAEKEAADKIQKLEDAATAELSVERKAAAMRSQAAQKWTALQEKEEAIVEAAKERAIKNEKRRAGIRETLRKKALAEQVATWKEEAEAQAKIEEERASSEAEFMQRRMEDIERITQVSRRGEEGARREEPSFVGAEQLWKRAMVAGAAEPTIRNVIDEEKKHTIQFDNILKELVEFNESVGALGLGLVE